MTLQQRIEKAVLLLQEHGFTVSPPNQIAVVDTNVPAFDEYWKAYGKQVGRNKAERLWIGLTTDEKRACMEYVPLYVMNTPDRTFRKNPETFLRNKCWNDEIITKDNGTDKRTLNRQQQLTDLAGRISHLLGD